MISLIGIALFCTIFTFVYEKFSYGESSLYMRFMFLAPLVGALLYLLAQLGMTWMTNRLSTQLFNVTIATIVSGCLCKGIIEVSGRTTTLDQPYWIAAGVLFVLSLLVGLLLAPKPQATV
ncbi:hypothetical protein ACVR05_05800 [Streptococcus caprae]